MNSAAYRFILIHENDLFGAIRKSRDAEFFENVFPMKSCTSCMLSVAHFHYLLLLDLLVTMKMLSLDAIRGPKLNPLLALTSLLFS